MPTTTFFRLPQEKRDRLLLAAEEEFTRVNFSDASINRIVQGAHIPRGSFYQYFNDKEDIFFFLLDSMRDSYILTLDAALTQANGNVFEMPLRMFDLLIAASGLPVPELEPCVKILKLNQSMDVQSLLSGKAEQILPQLLAKVDRTLLRRQDDAFVFNIFHLLIFALVTAMLETLWDPEKREEQRTMLEDRIAIIRFGSANGDAAGEDHV